MNLNPKENTTVPADHQKIKVDKLDCQTDITALQYFDHRLFIGCGKDLEVYCLYNKRRLVKQQVFDCFSIYGIELHHISRRSHYGCQMLVIVYGDRFFSIYKLHERYSCSQSVGESGPRLILFLDKINLNDWILDVQFKVNKVYCLLSSNKMGVYDLDTMRLNTISCEQISKVYTSKFLNDFNRQNMEIPSDNLSSDDESLIEHQLNHSSKRSSLDEQSSIVVAAGTVFSEILICEYTNSDGKIIDRLTGHHGVLLSIDYKKELDLLVSASDDRTVRLWKFNSTTNRFSASHVLYGHDSRIWQVKLSKSCIVSCGENSNLFLWSYGGECLFKEKSKRQSYWRLALDENNDRLFYGATDGSITQRKMSDLLRPATTVALNGKNIKRMKFFNQNFYQDNQDPICLVTDTLGKARVIRFQKKIDSQINTSNDSPIDCSIEEMIGETVCEYDFGTEYSNYNVLDLDETDPYGVLGNIKGEIVTFMFNEGRQQIEQISKKKLLVHQIINVLTTKDELVVCGLYGEITVYKLCGGVLCSKSRFNLPLKKEKIHPVNCALRLNNNSLIVFGDRFGNVIVYKEDAWKTTFKKFDLSEYALPTRSHSLVKFYRNVHGWTGVKYLVRHPFRANFYSCGCDGRILEYGYKKEAENDVTDLLRVIKIGLADMDWIARIEFDKLTGDLTYVCGFKSTLFIVWNNQTRSIFWTMESCGGSRLWSLAIASNRLNLIFLKHDELIFASKELDQSIMIKPKYHRNKVLCAQPLFLSIRATKNKFYFITGSEDCDLFINSFDRLTERTTVEAQLHGHISNVRSCVVEDLNNDIESSFSNLSLSTNSIIGHSLLISVGGVSQIMIWDITLDLNHTLVIKQLVNYFIWSPDKELNQCPWVQRPKQTTDSQVRLMDVNLKRLFGNEFLISAVCSDATLRLFRLSLDESYIYLISTHKLSNHCPLKMINHNELSLIASTDGSLRLIKLNLDYLSAVNFDDQGFKAPKKANFAENPLALVVNQSDDSNDEQSRCIQILQTVQQHQFGINSIDYIEWRKNQLLIFTAGEDTSLGYMLIQYQSDEQGEKAQNEREQSKEGNDDEKEVHRKEDIKFDQKDHLTIKLRGKCLLQHSSMVSRVRVLNNQFLITASWDSRIKIWSYRLDDELILDCKRIIISSIPDISEVIIDRCDSNKVNLIVLGGGREIYQIDLNGF